MITSLFIAATLRQMKKAFTQECKMPSAKSYEYVCVFILVDA